MLDYDFDTNVSYYVNAHVHKMILETAQLLCNVYANNNLTAPYKPCKTHLRHPCTLWAGKSIQNFRWLTMLGKALGREYTYRYGKHHASERVIDWCCENNPNLPNIGLTPFVQCMPDEYKDDDAVLAYRKYYNGAKQHIAKWKNRIQPNWFIKT